MDIPGLDQVRHCEDGAKEDADAPDRDVCDSQERVFAAHYSTGRDDDRFCTAVDVDWKV